MTEVEWLACEDLAPLLGFLRLAATDTRRLRLLACGCCRQVWATLGDARLRKAVRKLEAFAEDPSDARLLRDAYNTANAVYHETYAGRGGPSAAACTVLSATCPDPFGSLFGNLDAALHESRGMLPGDSKRLEAGLVRDVFGNPFRPVDFSPAWRTDTAVAIAQGMYESRDFGAMPILADALQDAECDNAAVLGHCRDPHGVHVRGCWVVDLVLGKE